MPAAGEVSTTKFVAALGVTVLWTAVWSVSLLGLHTARKRYRNRPYPHPKLLSASTPAGDVPGVTIIRPLLGLDPNLFYNLQTTLALEYPSDKLEIIFAIQDPLDPALGVVRLLLDERVGGDPSGPKRWGHLDVKIIVNSEVVGTNPKINNLVKPFEQAKFEILWVVDATVSLTSSMLARSVESLITPPSSASGRPTYEQDRLLDRDRDVNGVAYKHTAEYSGVGIVHHLPNAWVPNTTGRGTFGSRLEACYLNGVHGRMYLAINATGLDSCVVGKSNMYRKSTISALRGPTGREEPKGLKAFSPYLPEDNLIAHGIMHQLKLAHAMTPDLAMDCLGPMTLTQYVARRVRWIRVRKKMVLAATLIEPLTESILLGIVASWAAHLLIGIKPTWFFVLHESAWTLMDLMVVAALRGEYLKGQELVDWLFVWAVREALALPVWLKAMLGGDRVVWRSTTYKILKNGTSLVVLTRRSAGELIGNLRLL